jgi:hypothetical protein
LKAKKIENLGATHNNKTNGSFGLACIIKKLEALKLHAKQDLGSFGVVYIN